MLRLDFGKCDRRLVDQSRTPQIYANFEPMINASAAELLDDPKMISQFIGLVRRCDKIDHQPSEHDDFSNACARVLILAAQVNRHSVWMVDFSTGKVLTEREMWTRTVGLTLHCYA